jgi:hypothetical protein
MHEKPDPAARETVSPRQVRFTPSLLAAVQPDVDAAAAAGERLAASADPEATPLPMVRLPAMVPDSHE